MYLSACVVAVLLGVLYQVFDLYLFKAHDGVEVIQPAILHGHYVNI